MTATEPSSERARRREVVRQAGVALQGRVVTLWEVSPEAEVIPLVSSVPDPPYHATKLDLDATLRRWGTPIIQRSRWVGCPLDETGRWCVAPVRTQPAAPPPEGVERRSRERITLELAGLCLGLIDRAPGASPGRLPESEALLELSRHPSVIAHEVASPLSAALVSVDLCLDAVRTAEPLDPTLRAELVGELANVAQHIDRAVAFLRSIQDRARGALARSERFDAVQVVRSCVTLERPLARRQAVALNLDSSVNSVYLQGDPNALYQVLTNLIRNAVAASQGRKAVGVGLAQGGGVLRLTVRDQGAGIASEHLERIFEPGFTTKAFGAGSGMGLTVVRQITHDMFGGTVQVESLLGQGSVFTVALPISPQRAPAGPQ